jgi:hypothetical protein
MEDWLSSLLTLDIWFWASQKPGFWGHGESGGSMAMEKSGSCPL